MWLPLTKRVLSIADLSLIYFIRFLSWIFSFGNLALDSLASDLWLWICSSESSALDLQRIIGFGPLALSLAADELALIF